MDMSGEQRIDAPRDVVWAALNNPETLRKCIPGCQELNKDSETEMTATAVIKVGPVSAKFQGAVTLSDLDPPNGYRITGEGQGGVAGFAKGSAEVRLREDGEATILTYRVSAQIGGKLSQLGGRLIDATARKMSDAFFKKFAEEIAGAASDPEPRLNGDRESAADRAAQSKNMARATLMERSSSQHDRFQLPAHSGATSSWMWLNTAILLVILVALGWLMLGGVPLRFAVERPSGGQVSLEFSTALQVLLVGVVGYLIGRQQGVAREAAADRRILLALLAASRPPQIPAPAQD